MKLKTLVQDNPNRKLTIIINEAQFRALAENVLLLQEQKQIIKNFNKIIEITNEKKVEIKKKKIEN